MRNLKSKIRAGETVHGCWVNMGSHVSAEIMGRAGFDWLLIDQEHGAGTETEVYHTLQALKGGSAEPIIRLESAAPERSKRALDMGIQGIMFPQLGSAAEADAAVKAMYYKPVGTRGSAGMVRATGFGSSFREYAAGQRDNLVSMVQIETAEILREVEAVAALELVDVLFVGPMDLCISLGIPGQYEHARYLDALKKTVHAAHQAGKAAGIMMMDLKDYARYYDLGFRVLACGSDGAFVIRGSQALVADMAAIREKKQ
jgi:4-hydroxy-2-oxoheptanedioate aldolase